MTEHSRGEIAAQVIEFILESDVKPSGPDDPRLEGLARLIAEGLRQPGFFSELARQADAAGLKVPAKDLAELLIDVARLPPERS